jgi:hypothetical protein
MEYGSNQQGDQYYMQKPYMIASAKPSHLNGLKNALRKGNNSKGDKRLLNLNPQRKRKLNQLYSLKSRLKMICNNPLKPNCKPHLKPPLKLLPEPLLKPKYPNQRYMNSLLYLIKKTKIMRLLKCENPETGGSHVSNGR